MKIIDIDGIKGFKTGHFEDVEAATGCTVILSEEGAVCGCDIRGGAPATRETDLLKPENSCEKINGIILSGGSAFGLSAACGCLKYLKEKDKGFKTAAGVVPIICGASLFDLSCGRNDIFPDSYMGYMACKNTEANEKFKAGNFGAGTGALIGKFKGNNRAMKSGAGSFALEKDGLKVGAVVCVNALGDIYDESGKKIAGILSSDGTCLSDTSELMISDILMEKDIFNGNTTIGCIFTNANLTKAQCTKAAQVSHDAIARAIKPSHTSVDGDSLFFMAGGEVKADFDGICILSQIVLHRAILNAVKSAKGAYGFKGYGDLND